MPVFQLSMGLSTLRRIQSAANLSNMNFNICQLISIRSHRILFAFNKILVQNSFHCISSDFAIRIPIETYDRRHHASKTFQFECGFSIDGEQQVHTSSFFSFFSAITTKLKTNAIFSTRTSQCIFIITSRNNNIWTFSLSDKIVSDLTLLFILNMIQTFRMRA